VYLKSKPNPAAAREISTPTLTPLKHCCLRRLLTDDLIERLVVRAPARSPSALPIPNIHIHADVWVCIYAVLTKGEALSVRLLGSDERGRPRDD
jgi:hypothetical protein